jgi:ketosteroid isomerase-like protein
MTRLRHPIVAASFVIALAANGQAPTPQQQLAPIVHEMEMAANVHDTDRFMAAYLHQPTLIFVINGEIIHGWDDLRTQQLKWWLNGKTDVVYTPAGAPEYTVLKSDTVLLTLPLASSRTAPDGQISKGSLVVSMLWEKLPEGWRIVYAHESSTR